MLKQYLVSQYSLMANTMVTLLSEKKFKIFMKFRNGFGLY
jgi:hypothetical protein